MMGGSIWMPNMLDQKLTGTLVYAVAARHHSLIVFSWGDLV
jgi:hypothetical protein